MYFRAVFPLISFAPMSLMPANIQSQHQSASFLSSFWNDPEKVSERCLSDPPPEEILELIQQEPWRGGLEPIHPHGIPIHTAELVEGRIPSDLKGILFRNGPGRLRVGASQYGHWFDGDGLVTQLSIDGSRQAATFQAKYVKTERFKEQQKLVDSMKPLSNDRDWRIPFPRSGAWSKRGSTGSRLENLFTIPTNPSNTNVLLLPPRNGQQNGKVRLYALAEGGDPVLMDSESLETSHTEKICSASGNETVQSFFSAHYAVDPISNMIYNHGLSVVPPKINLMKLDEQGYLVQQASTKLPSLSFIHDNALSENYLVLVVPPFFVNDVAIVDSLLGGDPLGKQFQWNEKNENATSAMIFDKESLECVAEIPLPLLSTYHLVDAFETNAAKNDDENMLVFRLLEHGPPPSDRIKVEKCFSDLYRAGKLPLCKIIEYTIDIKQKNMKGRRIVAPDALPCELPDTNTAWGYKKRYCYTNTRQTESSFTDSIQRVDMETGDCSGVVSFGNDAYAGAPLFVPKPTMQREDDGYVVVTVYRSNSYKSDICILDARTMKTLALLRLQSHVPYQFHGAWLPL